MIRKYIVKFAIIILLVLLGCNGKYTKSETVKFPEIKITSKEFNFESKSVNDTINFNFKITNMSNRVYIIDTLAASCGCTSVESTLNNVDKDESVIIKGRYIPVEDGFGAVKKSIVLSDNTKSGFTVLYIKGNITK